MSKEVFVGVASWTQQKQVGIAHVFPVSVNVMDMQDFASLIPAAMFTLGRPNSKKSLLVLQDPFAGFVEPGGFEKCSSLGDVALSKVLLPLGVTTSITDTSFGRRLTTDNAGRRSLSHDVNYTEFTESAQGAQPGNTEPSPGFTREGVSATHPLSPSGEKDMVRTPWRHGEVGGTRNDRPVPFIDGEVTERKRANARGFGFLNGRFAMILHPDVMYDLLSDSSVTTSFERGAPRDIDEQAEFLGYVGAWSGFSFFETTNARIYSSQGATGADVYANVALARDGYGVTELGPDGLQTYYQPRGSSGAINDPLHQLGSLGWKCAFTAVILNQNYVLRVECGATP